MAKKRKTVTVYFVSPSQPNEIRLFLKKKEYELLTKSVMQNLFLDGGIREWIRYHASRFHRRRLRPLWKKTELIEWLVP